MPDDDHIDQPEIDRDRRRESTALISYRLGKVEERLEHLCEQADKIESRLDRLDRDYPRRDELIGNYLNTAELAITYVPRSEHMQRARERWVVIGGVAAAVSIVNIVASLLIHTH